MAKFIKLHEACGNDTFKVVLINADWIEHFKVGNKGTDTFVKLVTPSYLDHTKAAWFFVRESVEEIERMVFYDTRQPVVVEKKPLKTYADYGRKLEQV